MSAEPAFKRSPNAQIEAMRRKWPSFVGHKFGDGTLAWVGLLQPQAQPYRIEVFWNQKVLDRPYVVVADPVIAPRPGTDYADNRNLMFIAMEPTRSGLCLFDPKGGEWTPADLIADKTIYWVAEWLTYYELWHVTGQWLAPAVGCESVAQLRAEQARSVREMITHDLGSSAPETAA